MPRKVGIKVQFRKLSSPPVEKQWLAFILPPAYVKRTDSQTLVLWLVYSPCL